MCPPQPGDSDCPCHHGAPTTGDAATAVAVADLVLAARSDVLVAARWRQAVAEWVEAAGGGPGLVENVVLAAHEAVANAAEHAYRDQPPGEVLLRARVAASPVVTDGAEWVVEVSDRGRWQRPPRDPGYRGRGLAMIRALADRVDRVPTPTGTTITLTWTAP